MMKLFTKSLLRIGAGVLLSSSASLVYAQCTTIPNSGAPSAYDIFSYSLATSQGGGASNAGQAQFNYGVLVNCRAGSQITIDAGGLASANTDFRTFLSNYRTRYQAIFNSPPYFAPLGLAISRAVQTGPSSQRGGWVPTGGYTPIGGIINIYTTSGNYSASGFPVSIPAAGNYYLRFSPAMYSLHTSTLYGIPGSILNTVIKSVPLVNIGGQMKNLVVYYSRDNSGDTGVVDPPPPTPLSCSIGVKLSPDDGKINFGQMSASDLNNGRSVMRELTLSVGRKEACNRNQAITMTFKPDTKGLISGASASFSQGVLRLENNTRIEVRDKSNNAAINLTPGTKFNFGSLPQQSPFVPASPAHVDKTFSFTWKKDGTTPVKVGLWNAQILLEIEGS